MRVPFPRLRASVQPEPSDVLNQRDETHTVRIPSRISDPGALTEEVEEVVYATPAAAEQWDARRWSS